ncbi:MAG TPA: hypothetical protein ENJ41_08865 [Oceanospirillales bacterium]|nr:hypothetical protein [Oceanospirillales bacterium]
MNVRKKNIQIIVLVVVGLLTTVAYFALQEKSHNTNAQSTLPAQFKLGLVNNCRQTAPFITQLHMQQPAIDSKQQGHQGGLLIRDLSNLKHSWQHSSWSLSGFIGGFDRDNKGNIYVTPLPYVSLQKNPPERQNQIYIIDHKTAQMSPFLELPSKYVPNSNNPFGSMALFYDCDTHSLYVSSVAGSLPKEENGIIYQIDLASKKVVSTLQHTDAIGLGVFNTLKGKKLYYGSARKPHLYSVLLDDKGHFIGQKQYQLSLSEIQGGDSTSVKKILFKKIGNKYHMLLKETEFGFRLLAESNPNRKKYDFVYGIADDKWTFLQASRD